MSEHGTYAGYQTHIRHHTEPCDECRKANRDYMARYRAKARAPRRGSGARVVIERTGDFIAYLLFSCVTGGGLGYMFTWYVMELRS